MWHLRDMPLIWSTASGSLFANKSCEPDIRCPLVEESNIVSRREMKSKPELNSIELH